MIEYTKIISHPGRNTYHTLMFPTNWNVISLRIREMWLKRTPLVRTDQCGANNWTRRTQTRAWNTRRKCNLARNHWGQCRSVTNTLRLLCIEWPRDVIQNKRLLEKAKMCSSTLCLNTMLRLQHENSSVNDLEQLAKGQFWKKLVYDNTKHQNDWIIISSLYQ
jgi:hypothetical protein